MKRMLSFLQLICVLVTMFPPIGSYAAQVESYTDYPNYQALNPNQKQLLQQQFILKGTIRNYKKDMFIALWPLTEHNVVVYNYPSVCTTSKGVGTSPYVYTSGPKKGEVEYKYLGYDFYGKLVTNDYYTNGKIVGERDPKQISNFTYDSINTALDSWKKVVSEDTKQHMLNAPFVSQDEHNTENPYKLSRALPPCSRSATSLLIFHIFKNFS